MGKYAKYGPDITQERGGQVMTCFETKGRCVGVITGEQDEGLAQFTTRQCTIGAQHEGVEENRDEIRTFGRSTGEDLATTDGTHTRNADSEKWEVHQR
jgi:hypothetical protein